MQWMMDILILVGIAAWTVVALVLAWWLLIKIRVAQDRKDLAGLGEGENGTNEDVSKLRQDMNAKFSEFNGKFDVILILLEERAKPGSEKMADSSKRTTSRSKRPAKGE